MTTTHGEVLRKVLKAAISYSHSISSASIVMTNEPLSVDETARLKAAYLAGIRGIILPSECATFDDDDAGRKAFSMGFNACLKEIHRLNQVIQ